MPPLPTTSKNARQPWIWIYVLAAVVMTIAVAVFAWVARESRREAGAGRTAGSTVSRSAEIPLERFELLAQFEPPAYIPNETHGAGISPLFERAIQHYSKRDYAGAIPGLRLAAEGAPHAVEARFYLGICYLLTNARSAGLKELRSVIGAGDTPHLEAARFYAAKGLLGSGDVSGAQQQLENVIAMHGELDKPAQALLAQIAPIRK